MWCNTEAITPPQPLHKLGQHGGGQPIIIRLTLIYCIFITCIVGTCPRPSEQALITYSCLLTCFDFIYYYGERVKAPS